ncbi:MAG: hypothetical protein AAF125_25455, partial [Chloroflexota bacterium]
RSYCLDYSLIDFSLQIELFRYLWGLPTVRGYLVNKYRHLILDNIEEDTPLAHDILLDWIPEAESALIVQDTQAGYRRFLGAAPTSADRVAALVTTDRDTFVFTDTDSFVINPPLRALGTSIATSLNQSPATDTNEADPRDVLGFEQPRFYTEMIVNVAQEIAILVEERDVPPEEIVVLAPFLSDSLRYTLERQLHMRGIRTRAHRPSRPLRAEPSAQALLTWARIAHPEWKLPPTRAAVAAGLVASIDGLDLVRAQLAAAQLYKNGTLAPFDGLATGVQERVSFIFGERLQDIHNWLVAYDADPVDELDVFWSRLFGELFSRRGFGFHDNQDAAEHAANLIDSARKFRLMMTAIARRGEVPVSQEYVQMVMDGVIADQYMRSWSDESEAEGGVLLMPAYTFLMRNRPVDYQ